MPIAPVAEARLRDLAHSALDDAAPDLKFTWSRFEPHIEPGVSYFTIGMQAAARELGPGVADDVKGRVINHWKSLGLTPEQNATGVRVVHEDGYVQVINSGHSAVIMDVGSPPLPLAELIDSDGSAVADLLAPRQLEVLHMIAAGLSNQEIAARLVMSTATVTAIVKAVLDALATSRRELA